MKLFISIFFSCLIFLGFITEHVLDNKPVDITNESIIHPEIPDSLFSELEFEIEVYIQQGVKKPEGASAKKIGNGRFDSTLSKDKAMELDTLRLRSPDKKPVSLILRVPSDMSNPSNPKLRGISARFNEHFDPTYTLTQVLPGNRGIEITYYFKEGFPRNVHKHDPPIPQPLHVDGHICMPDDPDCSGDG